MGETICFPRIFPPYSYTPNELPSIIMRLLGLFLLFISLSSCREEDPGKLPFIAEKERLNEVVGSNDLFVRAAQSAGMYTLHFEHATVELPEAMVSHLDINKTDWKSTIHFSDQSTLELPTLGDTLTHVVKKVKLDPSGYCPLAAELQLSFPVGGRVRIIVEGKHGKQGDMEHLFIPDGPNQVLQVFGLYPGYQNRLTIILTDKEGRERARTTQEITTQSLEYITLPKIKVTTSHPEQMEPGVTLVNYLGDNEFDTHRPFMIDAEGEIRWLYSLKTHPLIGNITAHVGLQRMKNGNFLFGDVKTGRIIEADMLGEVKKSWNIRELGYEFHHEVTEMPNGNLLICVTEHESYLKNGEHSIYDVIIELDRETGKIVTKWDLKESLDESMYGTFCTEADKNRQNWAHNNAVLYAEKDDCIIICTRYQGLAKLDRTNRLKWLLSPHRRWSDNGFSGYLLDPLDASGNKIADEKLKRGEVNRDDFDWPWGAHCPVFMPNGNLLVFDNGYYRQYEDINLYGPKGYSRAVEYQINESQKTIRQVWQYGKERGRSCYGVAVSSVQYLPQTGNVLFCPGVGTPNVNGIGGKVIEVRKDTKEVVYEAHLSTPAFLVFHRATRMPLYPENY